MKHSICVLSLILLGCFPGEAQQRVDSEPAGQTPQAEQVGEPARRRTERSTSALLPGEMQLRVFLEAATWLGA